VAYCARVDTTAPYACAVPATNFIAAGTVLTDNDIREGMNALYGELKYAPTAQWTLTGNARHDRIDIDYATRVTKEIPAPFTREKSFGISSWRGGANYAATRSLDLFANVSTGFRTPTAEQLYNGSISPTGGKTANNENLKPEQALNVELGFRSRTPLLGVPFDLEGAVYQLERKDYIMSTVGQYAASTTTIQEMYDNIGGVRNRGLELALKSDRKRAHTVDVAYSYIRAVFTQYDAFYQTLGSPYVAVPTLVRFDNTGKDVPRVPRHQLTATYGWQPDDRLRLALEMDAKSWSWSDEVNLVKWPGRTLYHLQANYDVKGTGPLAGSKWSFFARVDNLFDRSYWSAARGTNDASSYITGLYDKIYNADDISIVVGKPRAWKVGLTATF